MDIKLNDTRKNKICTFIKYTSHDIKILLATLFTESSKAREKTICTEMESGQRMCVFLKLISIYRKQGFEIRTGLNPYHFNNYRDTPFTAIYKKGKVLSTGGSKFAGSLFFECLFERFEPKNIFIIGNAFGWSAVLMALLNPNGQVVALDAGIEGDFRIRLTNKIAEEEQLNIKVVKGFSPNDVAKTVEENFSNRIDFVFIDGLHTNEQQELDFNAVFNLCHKNCVYVFHDVVKRKMIQSFKEIVAVSGLNANVLHRIPSGMGILYPNQISIETKECIQAFSEKKEIIESLLESQTINHKIYVTIIKFLPKWTIKLFKRMKHVVRR